MKAVFVSDLHLQSADDPKLPIFLKFLDQECADVNRLYILGDLFDFWVGFSSVVFSEYFDLLMKLKELSLRGVNIIYLEGNHDFYLGPFMEQRLRIEVHKEGGFFALDGVQLYLAHGDQINRRDYGYRFLRWFLRQRGVYFFVNLIPPLWLWKIGRASSHTSRHVRKIHADTPSLFRDFAVQKWNEGATVVMLGHTHFPEEYRQNFGEVEKIYFNLGDWMSQKTYVVYQNERFELRHFI